MSDFSGMATVYGVRCNDGRVIKPGAFNHQDGQTVPIVWRHAHGSITNIIGHGRLKASESPPGMRVIGEFNSTKEGRQAKQLVDSRDITNLSIWANEILEHALMGSEREVEKGTIREVSLVVSGANPGALIDDYVRHDSDPFADEPYITDGIIIHTDMELDVPEEEEEEDVVEHAGQTLADIMGELNPEQHRLVGYILHSVASGEDAEPDLTEVGEGATLEEVYATLSHEQRTTLTYLVGALAADSETVQHADEESTVADI